MNLFVFKSHVFSASTGSGKAFLTESAVSSLRTLMRYCEKWSYTSWAAAVGIKKTLKKSISLGRIVRPVVLTSHVFSAITGSGNAFLAGSKISELLQNGIFKERFVRWGQYLHEIWLKC